MKLARKFSNIFTKFSQKTINYIQHQRATRSLLKFFYPYKLHVGCGKIKLDGWINIDIEKKNDVADIVWDAAQGLSFIDNNSCYLIYNEHFLEHLSIEKGIVFLSECHRILKKDGVIRIAMPSLEYTVYKYCSKNWKDQDWLSWQGHEFIQTRAEMINIAFRWWGHQWLYDQEELHRRLREAGFENIKDVEWGCSDILELRGLETRKDSILICEAIK